MNNKSKNLFLGFLFTLLILVSITSISATTDTNSTSTNVEKQDVATQTIEPVEKTTSTQVNTKTQEKMDDKIKTTTKENKKQTNTKNTTQKQDTTTNNIQKDTTKTIKNTDKTTTKNTTTNTKTIKTTTKTLKQETTSGTFTELQNTITKTIADGKNTLELEQNYTRGSSEPVITISQDFTIDGKGFTLDANGNKGIITITAGNVILTNMTITNSKDDSAILILYGANVTENSITTTNNNATYGGVNYNRGNLTINNGIHTNNVAIEGGVNFNSGNLTINNGTYKDNKATNGGTNCNYWGTAFNIINGTFTNNIAILGGVNYNWKGNMTINSGTYKDNKVTTNGGVNYNLGNLNITGGNYTNNKAKTNGGVNYNNGTLTIINGTFTNNTSTGTTYTDGGGVNYNNGTLTIINGTFTNNTSSNGGVNCNKGNLTINNGTYINNKADGSGGVNYHWQGNLTIKNGIFTNNTSDNGGVNDISSGTIIINDGTYTNNTATSWGGVNHNGGGNITITGGNYKNSTAKYSGGVNHNGGTLTIMGGNYTNNKANYYGGVNYNNGILTINNGRFSDNNANSGSVLYNNQATSTINNSSFIHNNGYVLFTDKGTFIVVNNSFINNLCNNKLFNEDMTPTTLLISNNTYLGNNLTSTMSITPEINDPITEKNPIEMTITIKPNDIYNTTINIGNITIYENKDEKQVEEIKNNQTTLKYTPQTGNYNLTIAHTDKTNSYTLNNITKLVNILKETYVDVIILNETVGNTTINVKVIDKSTNQPIPNAKITITYDTKEIQDETDDNGEKNITLNLPLGEKTITVTYIGDIIYNTNSTQKTFTVKYASTITAKIINNTAGKVTVEATVIDTKTEKYVTEGTVNVYENNIKIGTGKVDSLAETVIIETDIITKGEHTLVIKYEDAPNYANATTTINNVDIVGRASEIKVTVSNSTYGNITVDIEVFDSATSTPIACIPVNITLPDGTNITINTDESGKASKIIDLPVGDGSITVSYSGNDTYNCTSETISIKVDRRETNTTIEVLNSTATNTTIKVTVTDKTTGDKITNGTVTIMDNEGNIIGNGTIGDDGTIIITTNITQTGNQKITIKYNGDNNYKNTTTTINVDIVKVVTIITIDANDVKVGDNLTVKATLKDIDGKILPNKNITLTINSITKTLTTDENGIITYNNTTKIATTILITAKYNGDDIYEATNTIHHVKINKLQTFITLDDITTRINDTNTLTIKVTDEKGNNVNGGRVIIKVNGKTLRDEKGEIVYVTVGLDGTATVDVKFNQKVGIYTITAVYGGYSYYESSKNKNIKLTITPREVQLNFEDVKPTVIGDKISFKVKVTDNNTPVNGGKVNIKINNKSLRDDKGNVIYATVNNGIANIEFTLLDTFQAKTYNLTAVYTSSTYKRTENTTQLEIINSTNTLTTINTNIITEAHTIKLNDATTQVL